MERVQYRCVDPDVGALRNQPSISEGEASDLEAHLEICEYCRGLSQVTRILLSPTGQAALRGPARVLPALPVLLRVAALVALLLALATRLTLAPSRHPRFGERLPELVERVGENRIRILRPHEREVLPPLGGRVRWEPVPKARRYELRLRGEESYTWENEELTKALSDLPADLPKGEAIAEVRAVPDHLPGAGPATVSFERGDWKRFLTYRLHHVPAPSLLLGGLALLLLIVGLSRRRT